MNRPHFTAQANDPARIPVIACDFTAGINIRKENVRCAFIGAVHNTVAPEAIRR